ncbi:hypothetical protein ACQEV9_00905 [Streptomyces chartreusis]|uniref:hypothetical protein n=1 Tax=Streptomyces chartreusis TaxID=1969 RepID=UPI003D89EB7F
MASIGPPNTQEGASGFDPTGENPPVKFGVWGDTSKGHAVIGSSGKPGTGAGVFGVNVTTSGFGVLGQVNGDTAVGVAGLGSTGTGVSGTSTSGTGVKASSPGGVAIRAEGDTGVVASGTRIAGEFTSAGTGVSGTSTSGTGVKASSPGGVAIRAEGDTGVVASGTRIAGEFTSAGTGVSGSSTSGTGVMGSSPEGVAIRAEGDAGIVVSGTRIAAQFTGDVGIGTGTPEAALEIDRGESDAVALHLRSSGPGWGSGLRLSNTADVEGVYGTFAGEDGGWHFTDVLADSDRMVIDSQGLIGIATDDPREPLHVHGAIHSSGGLAGLSFMDRQVDGYVANPGSQGSRWMWYAFEGGARLWSGSDRLSVHPGEGGGLDVARRMRIRKGNDGSAGLWFHQNDAGDRAFVGMSSDNTVGFFGVGAVQWGMQMHVETGVTTFVGRLEKLGGGFKIDHPLDPAGKYLSHSFVESPGMTNLYDGTVVTDENGDAKVVLPDYFEALNRDFRYQLTPVGELAIAAVTGEIRDNSFTIRTDKPGVRVCWQVTGVRQDAWANVHRIVPEEEKPEAERDRYLCPAVHGQSADRSVLATVTAGR